MKSRRKIQHPTKLSEEMQSLFDVINNESDLACVLIGASYLDQALAALLTQYFIESGSVSMLLDPPKGALSTYASRYTLAYCLGLIPKQIFQNLEVIGSIRNIFAHSHLHVKFTNPEVVELVDQLKYPTIDEYVIIGEIGSVPPV